MVMRMLWMGFLLVCACALLSIEASAQNRSGTYRNRYGEIKIQETKGNSRSLSFSI